MVDEIRDVREQRKNCLKEICRIFENDITDENIRTFIFGKSGYSVDVIRKSDRNDFVLYMKSILSLSFYFAYACYRCEIDKGDTQAEDLTSPNAKRVIKSLDETFSKTPVTQELINFVLTDIQFDLVRGNFSELSCIFDKVVNIGKDFSLIRYFNLLAEYKKNPAKFQFDTIEVLNLFIKLLRNVNFLSEYILEQRSPDSFVFYRKIREGDIYDELELKHILFRDDSRYFGGIYALFRIDKLEKTDLTGSAIRLTYQSPDGDKNLSFLYPDDSHASHLEGQNIPEIYSEITGNSWREAGSGHKKSNSNIIDQIHTVNYKYIKNLALAISDSISVNDGSKGALYRKYNSRYPYIFPDCTNEGDKSAYLDPTLDWDTIVIMLLIEESPSIILEYIIRKYPGNFYHIVKNLYERAYSVKGLELFKAKKPVLDAAVDAIIKDKLIVGESSGFGQITTANIYDKLFPRAATMLILSKLSEMQEIDHDDSLVYTGNMRSNISLLQASRDSGENEKKVKNACIILGETFKHLMCFYSGLLSYGQKKAMYDAESYGKCLSDKVIEDYHSALKNDFLKAAKVYAGNFSGSYSVDPDTAIVLMEQFLAFCEKCKPNGGIVTNESKNLYSAIGKYEITDTLVLQGFLHRLKAGSVDKLNYNADVWIDTALDILEYLKTGSTSQTPIESDLFNAVYPFTAVFNRRKENPDGYKTVTFSLNIDVDDDNNTDYSQDVNVLSEFNYESDVYYCLPNVLRSNCKWWIDPVLISFKDFNDIFPNNGKDI